MLARILKYGLVLLIFSFTSQVIFSQKQIQIGILPMLTYQDNHPDTEFIDTFPPALKEAFNRTNDANYSAIIIEQLELDSAAGHISFDEHSIPKSILLILKESVQEDHYISSEEPFYFIQLLAWKTDDIYHTDVSIINSNSYREEFRFEVKAYEKVGMLGTNRPYNYKDQLISEIIDKMIMGFAKRIRIALFDFEMHGRDSNYISFEQAIPSMIESRIVTSSQITLLESSDYAVVRNYIDSTRKNKALLDERSLVQRAKLMAANYFIKGDYLVLDGTLQLNAKCTNVQTNEIIAKKSINTDEITISNLNHIIDELTNKLLIAIKADASNQPLKSIAIVGLPPKENTGENQFILQEIVSSMSKKLKYASILQVGEDPVLSKKYMKSYYSKWIMSSEFGTDYLVMLQMIKIENIIELEVNIFEPQNPNKYKSPIITKTEFDPELIDQKINDLLKKITALAFSEDSISEEELHREEFDIYKPFVRSWRIGGVLGNSEALYINSRGRFIFEYGFAIVSPNNPLWRIEPSLQFELYGETGGFNKFAFGVNPLVNIKRKLSLYRKLNWYFGFTVGGFSVIRLYGGDYQGAIGPGFGPIIGFDMHPTKLFKSWTVELKYLWGPEIKGHTISAEEFSGGYPGGFYLTFGRSINF